MPYTHDVDNEDRIARNQARRDRIFKVVEILFWVVVIIIVVGVLVFMTLNIYGTEPIPVDAIPTFYQ